MSNDYWTGDRQAQISVAQMRGDWRGRSGVGTTVQFMNRAFEIYYQGITRINASPDDAYRERLLEELRGAARTGHGWHPVQHVMGNLRPDDLEEAFMHLVRNDGEWRDNAQSIYMGGANKVFRRSSVVAPTGIVNFMHAVDRQMDILGHVAREFEELALELDRLIDRGDWQTVGSVLGRIKNGAERVTAVMWWSPYERTRGTNATTFLSVVSAMHSGLTTWNEMRRAPGFDPDAAAAVGAFAAVVNLVPVLGTFYGRAVQLIPAMCAFGEAIQRRRYRTVDAIAAGTLSTR